MRPLYNVGKDSASQAWRSTSVTSNLKAEVGIYGVVDQHGLYNQMSSQQVHNALSRQDSKPHEQKVNVRFKFLLLTFVGNRTM